MFRNSIKATGGARRWRYPATYAYRALDPRGGEADQLTFNKFSSEATLHSLKPNSRKPFPKRALLEHDKEVRPSVCQRRLVSEDQIEQAIWKLDPTVDLEH
jgi:hypothetical protein